ncbi:MAG TPA: aminotransferase class I/II-fold pyridoxal phosphate-dependent enzyme, partial [Methylococcales bacterium]|nr:aminotransferase class I/II-fold pyridoxal phosphate-dependent enzyme [Methylococcales bacterium]
FPDVSKAIARLNNIENDLDFAEHLIINAGVAVVPGSAFGCPDHIRISIATSMENLENAIKRIGLAL